MKTHFTIRRAPQGNRYYMRLFLSGDDAEKFRYERRVLRTREGKHYSRYGFASRVTPKQLEGGWAWSFQRQNERLIPETFQEMEPKERRYYAVKVTIESIEVLNDKPIRKEEIE